MAAEDGGQHLGIGDFSWSQAFFLGTEVEALVYFGGPSCPVDLQRPQKGESFAGAGLEPGKIIGNKKPRGVGKIGKAVGVADKKAGDLGHNQEDLSRAPARKPAKRKARSTLGNRRSKPKR